MASVVSRRFWIRLPRDPRRPAAQYVRGECELEILPIVGGPGINITRNIRFVPGRDHSHVWPKLLRERPKTTQTPADKVKETTGRPAPARTDHHAPIQQGTGLEGPNEATPPVEAGRRRAEEARRADQLATPGGVDEDELRRQHEQRAPRKNDQNRACGSRKRRGKGCDQRRARGKKARIEAERDAGTACA